jgi:tetratricopeptide (TPR) repeat protein
VPPLKDLLEITFMGPGLVCIAVMLIGGGLGLAKRIRAHRAAAIERLTNEATKLLAEGELVEAKAKAEQAVGLAHPKHSRATTRAHFCLGRILGRLGELPEAEAHLAKAMDLDNEPHLRALAAANLSMVLTKQGRSGEALDRAAKAMAIHDGLDYPEPFMRAGAGWANVAMSLAQTDTGKDGLPAAEKALAIFDQQEIPDGLAYGYFAKAHALQGKDNAAAFAAASEAHSRFIRLHAAIPSLYGDRLADSRKLLDLLGDADW